MGFGGSCFKKDILNLVYLCRVEGLEEVADYIEKVIRINEYQKERFVLNMLRAMFNTLAGKTEWSLYRGLDYGKIHDLMVKPAFIFDGRNILDHRALFEIGFNVYPIGKRPLSHL